MSATNLLTLTDIKESGPTKSMNPTTTSPKANSEKQITKRWAYGFAEMKTIMQLPSVGGRWDSAVALLGGKGAGLFRMTELGLPVPPGFTITTEAALTIPLTSKDNVKRKNWKEISAEVLECLRVVEAKSGKALGSTTKPLLVSCRSGARVSMPGMLDTVLNIGLNDSTVEVLISQTGNARFVYDSYRRLIQGFGSIVLEIDSSLFENSLKEYKQLAGYKLDTELNANDWSAIVKRFKSIIEAITTTRKLAVKATAANESGSTGDDSATNREDELQISSFPQDVLVQLRSSIRAVFRSWNNARAVAYREKCNIPHSYGTACTIQSMVFGNTNDASATGVGFTRSPVNGERVLYGEYLVNAQGEDVVAGVRNTCKIAEMSQQFPSAYKELLRCCYVLENSFANMQDIEFTVENNTLWMLQCRNGKRTAKAQVKIAVDMVAEGLINKVDAIRRVSADDINTLLLPQLDRNQIAIAAAAGRHLTRGVNACPGGAVGRIVFDAETAGKEKANGNKVILCRQFTKPEDVIGFFASEGVLTVEGGATSHAAVVARQFGIPCICGAQNIVLNADTKTITVVKTSGSSTTSSATAHPTDAKHIVPETKETKVVLREGDWLSLDATTGDVYIGQIARGTADFQNETQLKTLLDWCDEYCDANGGMKVFTNADSRKEAVLARSFGANGLGLCRTEHTFFEADRLPIAQALVMADSQEEREKCLSALLPYQRQTFLDLFEVFSGRTVVIRTLDPPLHEFLPDFKTAFIAAKNANAKPHPMTNPAPATIPSIDKSVNVESKMKVDAITRISNESGGLLETDPAAKAKAVLEAIERHSERNPMIGFRGCRVGILYPEIITMQVTAMCQAAVIAREKGFNPRPELMIPLTVTVKELEVLRRIVNAAANAVWSGAAQAQSAQTHEKSVPFGLRGGAVAPIAFRYGTMIETPRAALTAGAIAKEAEFFSFGTNDLTQMTFGIARDDAERHFLLAYVQNGILESNPFQHIDEAGVGSLVSMATAAGRAVRGPEMEIGVCGEVGGDPKSIAFFHAAGLTYVSCSAYRVPVARLACAHATIATRRPAMKTNK